MPRSRLVHFKNMDWTLRFNLAAQERWVVERRYFLAGHRKVTFLPNLLAEVAVFLVA